VIREEGEGKKTLEAMTALAKLLGGRPPTSRSHSPAILFLSSGIAAAVAPFTRVSSLTSAPASFLPLVTDPGRALKPICVKWAGSR